MGANKALSFFFICIYFVHAVVTFLSVAGIITLLLEQEYIGHPYDPNFYGNVKLNMHLIKKKRFVKKYCAAR